MVYANTLCNKLLNVKSAVVEGCEFYTDIDGVNHIRIKARPNRWHEDDHRPQRKQQSRKHQQNS